MTLRVNAMVGVLVPACATIAGPQVVHENRIGPPRPAKQSPCNPEYVFLGPKEIDGPEYGPLGQVTLTDAGYEFTPAVKTVLEPYACKWGADVVTIQNATADSTYYFFLYSKTGATSPATRVAHAGTTSAVIPPLAKAAKMIVLDLRAVGDQAPPTAKLVSGALAGTLHTVENLETFGMSDIQAMLTVERARDALGCDAVACAAELGGALGAQFVLYGELGRLGSQYTTNISVVDVGHSEVAARVTSRVPANEDAIVDALPAVAAELVNKINESMLDRQ